jgi:hypothetical protein
MAPALSHRNWSNISPFTFEGGGKERREKKRNEKKERGIFPRLSSVKAGVGHVNQKCFHPRGSLLRLWRRFVTSIIEMYVIRAPCVFCVFMGFGFSPDSVFRSALCSGGFGLLCTSTLSLSLSPPSFFVFHFLSSSLLLYELLVLFVWHWGRGRRRRIWICYCFFLVVFSPALNRFFSGVIERYVRVLSLSSLSLSLSLSLCVLVVACHHLCLCYLLCYLLLALLDGCGINFTPPLCWLAGIRKGCLRGSE